MEIKTRRSFFGKMAAMVAVAINSRKLFSQQAPPSVGSPAPGNAPAAGPGGDRPRAVTNSHTYNGIYYFFRNRLQRRLSRRWPRPSN